MSSVVERDERWMRDLWDRNYEDVLRYALRRADPESAADVAAEAFAVAWRRRGDVPDRAEREWLFGVARRTLANSRRSERRRSALVERLGGASPAVGPDPADRGDRGSLALAFSTLSASDREALSLTAWEGLTPASAARVAGCSEVAFRVRLHRARTRLRREIETREGEVLPRSETTGGAP